MTVEVLTQILAAIPSPAFRGLGPFRIYGLAIAAGVVAAFQLARRRWETRGGRPDDMGTIAVWAVPAGLVGARLYHVATDWQSYRGRWLDAFSVWEGGLGIPGGIAAGVLVGILVARHLRIRVAVGLDVVAPCLPLAQAIGRLGNWFNQELYGRPTDLPWGVEIDAGNRVAGYTQYATFHPTFLYEMVWNLALMGVLLWIDQRRLLRPGRLFALYVFGYGLGRLWVESLRIDPASLIFGVRVNVWTSLALITVPLFLLAVGGVRRRDDDRMTPYRDQPATHAPGPGPPRGGQGRHEPSVDDV